MLTERIARDAKPAAKTLILWDATVKGLGLRITPKGVKSYILNYRVNGRERRATIGRAAEISLKSAREQAVEQLVCIRAGEGDPLERKRKAREAPTVDDGLRRFFDEFAPARLKARLLRQSTLNEYRLQAGKYLEPELGRLKIAEVKREHVEKMVGPLPRTQRNRVLAFTSRLFNEFERWDWRPQHSNPCYGIEKSREEARDRVLAASELAALAKALNQHEEQHPASVAAIRVAALTGLRIGEVLGIQWQHIDFETGRLTLPETRTGRRVHDLPAPALALLSELPRFSTWAFTSTGKAAITYRTVRKHFAKIATAAGIEDVRLHDLRRTVMTRAAASGVGTHVLRDLLGHKTTEMADRYIRAVGDPVREAREQVGAEMAAMMDGEGGKDVSMGCRHG